MKLNKKKTITEFIEKKEVTNTTYEAQNEQYRYTAEVTAHSESVKVVVMNVFHSWDIIRRYKCRPYDI